MESKKVKSNIYRKALKIVPILAIVLMATVIYFNKDIFSLDKLFSAVPTGTFSEILFVFGLYIMKSISMCAPVVAIYMLSGRLFNPVMALIINTLGIFLGMSMQYFVGRFSGKDMVDTILARWPKFESIVRNRQKDTMLFACFIRFTGGLPMDPVSMFFGASGLPYFKYIVGSVIGCLPDLILYTLFSASLTMDNPVLFLSCVSMKIILVVIIGLIVLKRVRQEIKLEKQD